MLPHDALTHDLDGAINAIATLADHQDSCGCNDCIAFTQAALEWLLMAQRDLKRAS